MARDDRPPEGIDDASVEETGDGDWKFSLGDLEDGEDGGAGGSRRLEPGTPNPENALFVVLGMLIALFLIARGIGLV